MMACPLVDIYRRFGGTLFFDFYGSTISVEKLIRRTRIYPEDGGNMYLCNFGTCVAHYMTLRSENTNYYDYRRENFKSHRSNIVVNYMAK
jgi:hypothetical protein